MSNQRFWTLKYSDWVKSLTLVHQHTFSSNLMQHHLRNATCSSGNYRRSTGYNRYVATIIITIRLITTRNRKHIQSTKGSRKESEKIILLKRNALFNYKLPIDRERVCRALHSTSKDPSKKWRYFRVTRDHVPRRARAFRGWIERKHYWIGNTAEWLIGMQWCIAIYTWSCQWSVYGASSDLNKRSVCKVRGLSIQASTEWKKSRRFQTKGISGSDRVEVFLMPVIRLSPCFFTLENAAGNPRSYPSKLVPPPNWTCHACAFSDP